MPLQFSQALVRIAKDQSEWVGYLFIENGASGLEELDETETGLTVKLFFDQSPDLELFERLKAQVPGGLELLSLEEKPRENWQANWKEHFKPLEVGARFLIHPPWEKVNTDRVCICIDPGQGFGTGYHESTRLALRALEGLEGRLSGLAIDVGFGSGILTIGALKLGATRAICLEIEAEALDELPLNLAHSGLDPQLVEGRLQGPDACPESAQLVLANITGDVLLAFEEDLKRMTETYLLLSGIAPDYLEPVKEAFSEFELEAQLAEGEWTSLLYRRK